MWAWVSRRGREGTKRRSNRQMSLELQGFKDVAAHGSDGRWHSGVSGDGRETRSSGENNQKQQKKRSDGSIKQAEENTLKNWKTADLQTKIWSAGVFSYARTHTPWRDQDSPYQQQSTHSSQKHKHVCAYTPGSTTNTHLLHIVHFHTQTQTH